MFVKELLNSFYKSGFPKKVNYILASLVATSQPLMMILCVSGHPLKSLEDQGIFKIGLIGKVWKTDVGFS